MVNPATAVAALALDEMFTSAKVISGIQYSLTGSLQHSQIKLLEQTNKVVELPTKMMGIPSGPSPIVPGNPSPLKKSPNVGKNDQCRG